MKKYSELLASFSHPNFKFKPEIHDNQFPFDIDRQFDDKDYTKTILMIFGKIITALMNDEKIISFKEDIIDGFEYYCNHIKQLMHWSCSQLIFTKTTICVNKDKITDFEHLYF